MTAKSDPSRETPSIRPVTASSTLSSSSQPVHPDALRLQHVSDIRDGRAYAGGEKIKKPRKPQGKLRLSKKAGPSTLSTSNALSQPSVTAARHGVADDDDDWTFEGGRGDGERTMYGNGRAGIKESMEIVQDVREPVGYRSTSGGGGMSDALQDQALERDRDKDRESKGRRLVKKTSQLFGRKDKDKERDKERISPNPGSSSSSVYLPVASRQSSKSSGDSQDRRPLASRVPSGSSTLTTNGAGGGFLGMRRPSQDSQAALGAYTANVAGVGARQKARTGSTSTYESSIDAPSPLLSAGPLPQRRSSQLASSVPSLSRQSTQPTPVPVQTHLQQGPSVSTRMSAWFSGLISSSAGSDTSSTSQLTEPTTSPIRATVNNRGSSAAASFLNAARQKAVEGVRNLLDSEAQPDRCMDPIWLMGVSHPGYHPPPPTPPFGQVVHETSERGRPGSSGSGNAEGTMSTPPPVEREKGLRAGLQRRQLDRGQGSPAKGLGQLFGGSTASLVGSPSKDSIGRVDESPSRAKKGKEKEVLKWPEEFYTDFRSTVWCSYRSQYAPILALPQDTLIPSAERYYAAFGPPADIAPPRPTTIDQVPPLPGANGLSSKPSVWGWGRTEDRGLTNDAGWGCMLRTGQSMLANALISLHLGRDWRLPATPPSMQPTTPAEVAALRQYATYVRIISYFLDDPSPLAPFSVHRMALIGKALGKEVGEWFGPSTAQGALKTLANAFPPCGLTVVGGTDGMIYRSEVYEASHADDGDWASYTEGAQSMSADSRKAKRTSKMQVEAQRWGKKAVLVLVGLRLGLDGVNPIYHDSIKALFTFPQSVGIAGGRPSSSYYFVASQANSLFYLDPHFTRPAIPLETPPSFLPRPAVPPASTASSTRQAPSADSSPMMDDEDDFLASSITIPASESVDNEEAILLPEMSASAILADERAQGGEPASKPYKLEMMDADEVSSGSDHSFSPTRPSRGGAAHDARQRGLVEDHVPAPSVPPRSTSQRPLPRSPHLEPSSRTDPVATEAADVFSGPATGPSRLKRPSMQVDQETRWYASAYAEAQLKTFHCDKVRKVPLSALDPSMLLGFLCRDEADFDDFCERVAKLPQKIFSVQDEPPMWDDAASAGLESVSEPDFSSEDDDDEDGPVTIHSPLDGSLTLPARKPPGDPGLWRSTSAEQASKNGGDGQVEDLSATIRLLGMERDETVRGGLSGVVDPTSVATSESGLSTKDRQETKVVGSLDDPYESMPPTPRISGPGSASAFFGRPSVMLVQPREQPSEGVEMPNTGKQEAARR